MCRFKGNVLYSIVFGLSQMKEARVYHAKLLTLKKEMNNLMDKSTKMKVTGAF